MEKNMKKLPIMSVSGIRGVVGETLDSLFISQISYIQTRQSGGGRIVVGRDTRSSGEALAAAAFRGIKAAGGIPVDLGIAPTPTICVCVNHIGASSGIIITASHNPGQYNGYKMVHRSGRLFRAEECERAYEEFRNCKFPDRSIFDKFSGAAEEIVDGSKIHIEKIISQINVERIRNANLKIAIDSINGAAASVFPELLKKLNIQWIGVNNKLDGDFVHNPEPRPEHLGELSKLLKSTPGLHGGFVFDPDADRLATMGEHGEEISEEMTLVFALQNILSRIKTDIATNLSTSMLIDDVAKKFGVNVVRSKIGEANVVEAMEKNGCKAGGEGNGGVIFPSISSARDGLAGLALITELMAITGKTLSQLASEWPKYFIVKEKIPCEGKNATEIIGKLAEKFKNEKHDLQDGLKITRDYGWVHLRPSNTEPIIRCYAEARTEKEAKELAEMILTICK
jgi:phosphomannomutase